MEMSIDRAASRRYRSYRRHRNMWFVILGVLLVLLLTFGACLRLGGQLTKKAQILQDQPQNGADRKHPELMKMWSW